MQTAFISSIWTYEFLPLDFLINVLIEPMKCLNKGNLEPDLEIIF